MEWKLEGLDDIRPDRPWMNLERQPGFAQRAKLVADLARLVCELRPDIASVSDLGCGDGSLLNRMPAYLERWGYELGASDVGHAVDRLGLDVRQADILRSPLEYGDLIVASEVLEHLADPVGFLKGLPDEADAHLIASSPSAETGEWHNSIHSWAWDLDGYRDLLERGGWRVLYQAECDGGFNTFGGVTWPQRFQAIVAAR